MSRSRVRCFSGVADGGRSCRFLGPMPTGEEVPRDLYPYIAQLILCQAGAIYLEPGDSEQTVVAAFEEALAVTGLPVDWSWDEQRRCLIWVLQPD